MNKMLTDRQGNKENVFLLNSHGITEFLHNK